MNEYDILTDEEAHISEPLRYPEGGAFDVAGVIPAYVQLMTLEELGFLYLLECCQDISREAVFRLGAQRGLDLEKVTEISDFFFMHNRRRTGLQDVVAGNEEANRKPSKTQRRATSAKTMCLGEHEEEVGRLPVKGADERLSVRLDFLQKLESAYPEVDIRLEIERAGVWLLTHPDRMKTARGMGRFLNSWMQNASREKAVRSAVTRSEQKSSSPFGVKDSSPESRTTSDEASASGMESDFDAALDVLFESAAS